MLIEDKAEKRKCRGRGTGLCNLLLNDPSLRRTTCCSSMTLFSGLFFLKIKSWSVLLLWESFMTASLIALLVIPRGLRDKGTRGQRGEAASAFLCS